METLVGSDELPVCWCCGRSYATAEMVHLGAHPEVTVCFACARDLHRRARGAAEHGSHSIGPTTRRAFAGIRSTVVRRGWHRLPVIGPALRWIDKRLP